jgi:hypothetical protein
MDKDGNFTDDEDFESIPVVGDFRDCVLDAVGRAFIVSWKEKGSGHISALRIPAFQASRLYTLLEENFPRLGMQKKPIRPD